jgi:LacI family transcriptional regulator
MKTETSKEVTIYDIAEVLKISAATVSRSLNHIHGTSEKTRSKVLATAERMGYRYNTNAANLRRSQSSVIGVIVPRLNSHFIAEAIAGIETTVSRSGFTLMVSQTLEKVENETRCSEILSGNRVAGILASLSIETKEISHFRRISATGMPVIFFDRCPAKTELSCVFIDNFNAAYDLTTHLISRGYTRIMHVTASLSHSVYQARFQGFQKALSDHRIRFNTDFVSISDFTRESSTKLAHEIYLMKSRPQAVFFANDQCAAYCMLELQKLGIEIPQQMGIAGFNNDPISFLIKPAMTTIEYNGFEIGSHAAAMLVHRLTNAGQINDSVKKLCSYRLTVRDST